VEAYEYRHEIRGNESRHDQNVGSDGSFVVKATINLKQPEKMAREIRNRQIEKEERRRSEIAAREIDELTNCTFQPLIPTYYPPPCDEPVVVRGISRHLELMSLKDRLQEDKALREEAVFRVQNVDRYRNPHGTDSLFICHFSYMNYLTTHSCIRWYDEGGAVCP
jgi:hypothetical protein